VIASSLFIVKAAKPMLIRSTKAMTYSASRNGIKSQPDFANRRSFGQACAISLTHLRAPLSGVPGGSLAKNSRLARVFWEMEGKMCLEQKLRGVAKSNADIENVAPLQLAENISDSSHPFTYPDPWARVS
jgi:hypothetical protein